MRVAVEWWDRHQVALYVAAIAGGSAVGLLWPATAPVLSGATNPVLALLLFATFLGVPLVEVGRAFRDIRFLGTVLVVNFVLVPLIAFGLSRFVADDQGLLVGVLLVLLTPCVDYVIVFTGLAGGARARLLAATPLLMLLQIVLLPGYLWLFAGGDVVAHVELEPFLEAFLILIVIPLTAAAIVQAIARRHRAGRAIEDVFAAAMVPLMMATLAVVVGSQIAGVGSQAVTLLRVVPLYAAFLGIMLLVGLGVGRAVRLPVPETRAVIFSGATRNSLVVLPLALALPAQLAIAPLAVVTQTLVELVGMVVFMRLVPALTRARQPAIDR
ncbi:arsenic resistance protein [Streptomonospora nanhaiensis]|uniref:ACR3 family arsenite efflux pump ArsB n=1 Tax=Streptomonospora nanhaiensis TaxID=1323731 RepID=A0A853BUV2_9ACTN|nr:bile acid:sodium symporter [Streptomonospora nanhaiensis]MBV2363543.1 bile acid:sodium symporter [Streptomonospora nanhaiensis]NYI98556.1 ACR3 family arsenite efflux pump ArsB [Streptomonospora nanhaiensis]